MFVSSDPLLEGVKERGGGQARPATLMARFIFLGSRQVVDLSGKHIGS